MKTQAAILPVILLVFRLSFAGGLKDTRYPFEQQLTEQAKVALHVGFSTSFGYGSTRIVGKVFPHLPMHKRCLGGTGLAMIPGIGKEVYDKWIRGFDVGTDDLILDLAGCAMGAGIHFALGKWRSLHVEAGPKHIMLAVGF